MLGRRIAVSAIAAVIFGIVCLSAYTRGPEGCAEVKDVDVAIRAASQDAGLQIVEERSMRAGFVPLRAGTAIKRWLKRLASSGGVALEAREYAVVYSLQSADAATTIRCSVRIHGDHVLAFALSDESGDASIRARYRRAMAKRVPDCAIVERPNQAMQLAASNGAAGRRATWMGGPERVSTPGGLRIKPDVTLRVFAIHAFPCVGTAAGSRQLIL